MTATRTRPESRCSTCDNRVIWATTAAGKRMAVDPRPREDGNVELVRAGDTWQAKVLGRRPGEWDGIARFKPHVAVYPACRR